MAPLLAVDIGELLKAIVPILFLIIWVISQVIGEQGKRQQPGKGPKQRPQGGRPRPKGVAQEIEDFLRRAAQQRAGGGPAEAEKGPAAPTAEGRQPGGAAPPDERLRPLQRRPLRDRPERPLKPKAVDQVVEVLPSRDDIAESVERHLGGDRLGQHAEQLGDEIRDVDREVEERLHKKFDHQVGSLATDTQRRDAAAGSGGLPEIPASGQAVRELVALLRNPRGARHAILVSEILNRPEHRW
jgi:hypothetical protein